MLEGGSAARPLPRMSPPSGWNFRLEWLVWINGISETCRTSSIGEWVHVKSSMGPKQSLQIGATLSSKWTEGPRKKLFVFYFFHLIYVGIGLTKKISMRHFSKFWPYPPRLANNASFSVQASSGCFDKPA